MPANLKEVKEHTKKRHRAHTFQPPTCLPSGLSPKLPSPRSTRKSRKYIIPRNPRSIPSQNSTASLDNLLSPGWIHAITSIMGHPLKSEVGQKLQKWVLYHLIHDPTNFWVSRDPTDPEDIRLLQKYAESNGSILYLRINIVKNLIGLWDYMNLLIKQDRPADEK